MTTVLVAGRHRRTTPPGKVPTDRTHANHNDIPHPHGSGLLPCARCSPTYYALNGAQHRSDRS
jgi:hypothetical protein